MLQKFLTIGLPLLLPCLVYFGYVYLAKQRAAATGDEVADDGSWRRAPWGLILVASAVLMVAALVYVRLSTGVEPGTKLEPPHLTNEGAQSQRATE